MALSVIADSSAATDSRTLSWTIPTLATGDVIVVTAGTWDSTDTLNTPTGTGLSFTLQNDVNVASRTRMYQWTAVASSGGSSVVVTCSANSSSIHNGTLTRCPTADGYSLGAPNKNTATPALDAQGSVALTGTSGNAFIVGLGDWKGSTNAATWLVSATEDLKVQSSTAVGHYVGHGTLTGASTTVGLSAPTTGTSFSVVALEVLLGAPPPTDPGYGYLEQEDDISRITLENNSGFLLLDTAAADPIQPIIVLPPRR